MNFKLKIIYILSLFILFNPSLCFAKSITIDGKYYQTDTIIEDENFTYNALEDTLTLKGINISYLKITNNLKIILEGDNFIENNNDFPALSAYELEITGNGTLNINSINKGISCKKILLNNTNIKVKSQSSAFATSSTNNYDLIVNNSNLDVETTKEVFNVVNGNLYLNNSNINIENAFTLTGGFSLNTYIDNTSLNIKEIRGINSMGLSVYVQGNSKVYVHATNNLFLNKNYIIDDNLMILRSDDGINYESIINTSKDEYIKIINQIDNEEININEKEGDSYDIQDSILSIEETSNNIDNPKTLDNSFKYIIILFSSLIIIIFLLKRVVLNG